MKIIINIPEEKYNEENNIVNSVVIECTPSDYLLISKALKMLAENEEVHEIDRRTAKYLFDLGLKELKGED